MLAYRVMRVRYIRFRRRGEASGINEHIHHRAADLVVLAQARAEETLIGEGIERADP